MIDKLRVIIVDDEPIIVRGLENLYDWGGNGFEVVGKALNGQAGMELARQLKPDIVLTDIRMPKHTGLELISALKLEMPEIQFIIVSGYDDFSYCQEALRLGASDYILKPVDYKQLGEKLNLVKEKILCKREEEKKKNELSHLAKEGFMIKQSEFFKKLLHKPLSKDFMLEDCKRLEINFEYYCVAVAKCEISDVDGCMGFLHKELNSVLFPIENSVISVFRDTDLIVIVIGNLDKDHAIPIKIKETLTDLIARLKGRFYLGVGDVCSLDGISESYNKAVELASVLESSTGNQIFSKLKNYIDEHYDEDLNLKVLSKICNMNQFYVSQFFKDKLGKNYLDYLQDMRIGKAKELLLKSGLSISEISEKVGFKDYRIFIKVFKKYCGITPKQYTKRLEEEARK
jgi:two-component system, response regulator YesN